MQTSGSSFAPLKEGTAHVLQGRPVKTGGYHMFEKYSNHTQPQNGKLQSNRGGLLVPLVVVLAGSIISKVEAQASYLGQTGNPTLHVSGAAMSRSPKIYLGILLDPPTQKQQNSCFGAYRSPHIKCAIEIVHLNPQNST